MNAGNLMAAVTADGISAGAGTSKGRAASAENRAQTTSGKNSFSDTFGALQKGMTAETPKTEMREMTAPQAQTDAPKAKAHAPSENADQQRFDAKTGAESSADDFVLSSPAAVAIAALMNMNTTLVDADLNEGLDASLIEILQRYELTADQLSDTKLQTTVQSLLQQLPEDGGKSRNFLLALAGQPLTEDDSSNSFIGQPLVKEAATANVNMPVQIRSVAQDLGDASQVLRSTALGSDLHIEQSTVLNTAAPMMSEQMPDVDAAHLLHGQNLKAETVKPPAPLNTAVTAGNPQTSIETAAAPTLAAQAEIMPASQAKSVAQTVGENLIVDEGTDPPALLTALAQRTMRHDASQDEEGAGQGTRQEEQPVSSGQQTSRMTTSMPFEMPSRTAEPVQQPAQPITLQTGTSAHPVQEAIAPAATQETQRPQPDYEIPRQIVEQARLLRTLTDTQMVIRLRPEHLGDLTLRVSVGSNGAVQASFHSDNAHVRNVIENSLVQLRQELNNQGVKVDRVGVYTGLADGQMPQGQGQEAWQQSSRQQSGAQQVYARGDADDYLDEIDGLAPAAAEETGGSVGTDGVDYRV